MLGRAFTLTVGGCNEMSKIKEFKGEFKKIVWPSRKSLVKQTTTVIVMSIIIGLLIAAMDFTFAKGIQLLTSIL